MTKVKNSDIELNNDEFTCLVMRECATRYWSGESDKRHQAVCRFCAGILFASSDLARWGMELDDDGRPVPKKGVDIVTPMDYHETHDKEPEPPAPQPRLSGPLRRLLRRIRRDRM